MDFQGEQRVMLHGIPWTLYEQLSATRQASAGVRLTYCRGVLEIMNPGKLHETTKTRLGRLIEAYADIRGIELVGVGSWTLKREGIAGAEADESYIVGIERAETAEVPDLAVEVVVTGGSVGKLDVYKALGVPEVWFYEKGHATMYVLAEGFYLQSASSQLLPDLSPQLLERCMSEASPLASVRALRSALPAR